MTKIAQKNDGLRRLAELDLTRERLTEVFARADSESRHTTPLDPPTAEGLTRYITIVRFLREDLLQDGWTFDNPSNVCRTIHPSKTFSIVPTAGDELTGIWVPGTGPSTRNPKGVAAVRAVKNNAQLALFGPDLTASADEAGPSTTWYLLHRFTDEQIFVELSLPDQISDDGHILNWRERIIIQPFDRQPGPSMAASHDHDSIDEKYQVDVNIRE
ncbi:hypothetical protein EV191_13024 [Tamaricihabitans halophyticus]|uniref:Uncharacterized protein n=1 Tax=Tamaricihabitans halophyticus TaxID=1262583 RepID=A0A4V2SQL2_9PSEU|nr:hypothetical protein [Tamaricihabitans halophyticus]TCP39376.1 hypothetical protein EV191_13024 [Tamaricihabitans halophyticus]